MRAHRSLDPGALGHAAKTAGRPVEAAPRGVVARIAESRFNVAPIDPDGRRAREPVALRHDGIGGVDVPERHSRSELRQRIGQQRASGGVIGTVREPQQLNAQRAGGAL